MCVGKMWWSCCAGFPHFFCRRTLSIGAKRIVGDESWASSFPAVTSLPFSDSAGRINSQAKQL